MTTAKAAPAADPVSLARAAVLAARAELERLQEEDRAASECLARIERAEQVTAEDWMARENAARRKRQLAGQLEPAAVALTAALEAERAAVRAADGVQVIFGALAGPDEIGARSSIIFESVNPGTGAPPVVVAGARARVLSGLGILCAVPSGPRSEPLPFIDVRPDHAVTSARILERPDCLGPNGSESVQLRAARSIPGTRSEVAGSNVRSMRLVSSVSGIIGLRIESERSGVVFVPASNVGHAVLESGSAPGVHFVTFGACTAATLRPGTTIGKWEGKREPMPTFRVTSAELREGRTFVIGRGLAHVMETLSPDQGVEMESCEIGIVVKWQEELQVVPWESVKSVTAG